MSDRTDSRVVGQSAEEIAFKLYESIKLAEGYSHSPGGGPGKKLADRYYVLDTFAECMEAIRNPKGRLRQGRFNFLTGGRRRA